MEVHSHTHIERKKFTNYLWEFLMLFLAVFCGFLAENVREQSVEKHRSHQYIASLYQDLKLDELQMRFLVPLFENKNKRLDTMLALLTGVSEKKGANGLYNYFYEAMRYPDFVYTDRTIAQLKNSGGLRLISNKQVSDSIIGYDASHKLIDIHIREGIDYELQVIRGMNNKLFDLRCCPGIGNSDGYDNIQFPNPGKLMTYDEKMITEYYNNVITIKRVFNVQKWNLENLLAQNIRLQDLLKKEYHMK